MIDKPVDRSIDDSTLGGYRARHDRAPAFEGSDGHAYSVAVYVDPEPDPDGQYGASFLFVRWTPSGDRPAGHLETDHLAWADTSKAAGRALDDVTLHEIKNLLEDAITRRRELPDW